jgi:hypothetical protein
MKFALKVEMGRRKSQNPFPQKKKEKESENPT